MLSPPLMALFGLGSPGCHAERSKRQSNTIFVLDIFMTAYIFFSKSSSISRNSRGSTVRAINPIRMQISRPTGEADVLEVHTPTQPGAAQSARGASTPTPNIHASLIRKLGRR